MVTGGVPGAGLGRSLVRTQVQLRWSHFTDRKLRPHGWSHPGSNRVRTQAQSFVAVTTQQERPTREGVQRQRGQGAGGPEGELSGGHKR